MPQPVDMQTEIGRAAAVERIQQIADRASLAAVQRGADDTQLDRVAEETQVRETQQKGERVDEEGRRKNPYRRRRKHRDILDDEDELARENEAAAGNSEIHRIDVLI